MIEISGINSPPCHNVMPPYSKVQLCKDDLRPEGILITEDGCDSIVPMQNTLDKTVNRLLVVPRVKRDLDNFEEKHKEQRIDYLCYFKVGCDGMSGLVEFHQEWDEDDSRKDGKLMASHLILLQIVAFVDGIALEKIVYQNPLLNSAHSCRPLRCTVIQIE